MLAAILAVMAALILAIGYAAGAISTSLGSGRMAYAYARWLTERNGPQVSLDAHDDESRVDALTIHALIEAALPICGNEDAAGTLQLGEYTAFADALMAAQNRFADWIDWADAPVTKQPLVASEPAEADV